jgi:hypothetical protein
MKRDYNVALFPFTVILMGGVDGTFLSFLKNEKNNFLLLHRRRRLTSVNRRRLLRGASLYDQTFFFLFILVEKIKGNIIIIIRYG